MAPVVLVDGQDLFWWGVRTPGALDRLGDVLADLGLRPAPRRRPRRGAGQCLLVDEPGARGGPAPPQHREGHGRAAAAQGHDAAAEPGAGHPGAVHAGHAAQGA